MQDQLMIWEPIINLAHKYTLKSISDGMDGFEILLSAYATETNQVKIIFKDSVSSYRCTDESLRLSSLNNFLRNEKDKRYTPWTFFKIHHSTYAQWISEESYGLVEPELFQHFLLLTSNEVIDIIATYEPKVEVVYSSGT